MMAEAICKRCIHHDICDSYSGFDIVTFFPYNEDCEYFKSRDDYAEVRHGCWKETQGEVGNPFNNQVFDTIDLLVCSVCNEIFDVSEARNYCPYCGAKMDGKGEGE